MAVKKEKNKTVKKFNDFKVLNPFFHKDSGVYLFNLEADGVTYYGLKIVENKNTNEYFIAFPSRKGKDDRYYNLYYIPFDEKQSDEIIETVIKQANN